MAQVTYDTTDKAGDRQIQVIVDPNNSIAESDESDNSVIVPLTVAPPPAPNLVVEAGNISFSPSSPTAGDLVTVTVVVKNDGPVNAGKVEVRFLDASNGTPAPIGDLQVIPSIPSGSSGTVYVVYDTSGKEGERTIRVVADPNNLIAETDETDNQADATLTVAPPGAPPSDEPNLVVTSSAISFEPASPQAGDAVTISVVVTNSGEASASSVVVRFEDDSGDSPVAIGEDQNISFISAGSNGKASVVLDTTGMSGQIAIKVTADPDDTIKESNENDNSATKVLELGGTSATASQVERPNLVVRSALIQSDPSSPREGDMLTLAVTVRNEGRADAQNIAVALGERMNGVLKPVGDAVTVDYVPAGGSTRVLFHYDTSGKQGPCTLEVAVDPANRIREVSEYDNTANLTVDVMSPNSGR